MGCNYQQWSLQGLTTQTDNPVGDFNGTEKPNAMSGKALRTHVATLTGVIGMNYG